jgi:predicted RNA-binding protein YlxR (DUF448 family)
MTAPHTPERTCLGCRKVCPAGELRRLVLAGPAGDRVTVAARGAPGRGAWLHPRGECLQAALRGRAFGRTFRRPVIVPEVGELMAALSSSGSTPARKV